MRKTAIFTICSNNFMAYARTLLASVRAHHPDADLYLCLVGERLDIDGFYPEGCRVLVASELGIPDFPDFAFQYDIMELNTAVKPFVFLRLFAQKYDAVIYFDPDIELFKPLESVFDALDRGASFVLTPHLCSPAEGDTCPDDVVIMRAGVYNLGFLACSRQPETERLLHWWARHLRFECLNRQEHGIFVDQKFMDLVPGFADHCRILRDTTLNAAYFNLDQRRLTYEGGTWQIDGQPLTFFHFSGINPYDTTRLSKHTHLFHDEAIAPELQALIDHYCGAVLANGHDRIPRSLYAYGRFASGTPIHPFVRQMFRERYLPWGHDPFTTFEAFLHQPHVGTPRGRHGFAVSNFMRYLWDRFPWLRQRFHLEQPEHVEEYARWYVEHGTREWNLDPRMVEPVASRSGRRLPAPNARVAASEPGRPDVSVVGYFGLVGGVGEVGRQTLHTLRDAGLDVDGHEVRPGVEDHRRQPAGLTAIAPAIRGRVHIYNVNADQLPMVLEQVRPAVDGESRRVSIPFWELAEFPDAWLPAFDGIDEVWAPSQFVQAALFRKLHKPVVHMPVALDFDPPAGLARAVFGLPERKCLFFFAFDFRSFQERKNPRAAYRAFRRAFPDRGLGDVGLVVKSLNGADVPDDLAALRAELADDPDVTFVDAALSREHMLGLIAACDCVVSLHRSEGLGLLVLEAMKLGKPVIATDYSATTEFVTPETGFPVNFRLVPVKAGQYPFAAGLWAEPDERHAAWLMRRVHADYESARRKAARGRQHLEASYGRPRVAALQRERLRTMGLS